MKRENTKKSVCARFAFEKPTATLGALAAAISALYAPHTFAAEAGARQLDEVVVTARRREEMAQDVPISMTVMTEDFLRTNNITKVEDLGTKVPSMRITALSGSVNEPIISMRGQRQGEVAFNQDPVAPMYFNEIVIAPTQGSNLGLYDLEGLQVLKGPQGTLFGRNSTGGAVLITPKRPGNKLGGYVEVKVGDYDLVGFEGAVDVPLTDKLTTRIAAHKLDRDGYQENIADNALRGKKYRDEHSMGVRLSVNFENDSFSTLTVLAQDENDIAAAQPVMTGLNPSGSVASRTLSPIIQQWSAEVRENLARDNPLKIKTDVNNREYVKNVFASNTSEYQLADDLTVKNVFGYRKVFFETAANIDGTSAPAFGTPPIAALGWNNVGSTPVTFDPIPASVDTEFYSNELQLFGSALDNRLDWLTGVYWSQMEGTEDKLTQQTPVLIIPLGGGAVFANPTSYDSSLMDIKSTSYGLLTEATYSFTDEWSLTAGARQSWDEREMRARKWNNIARTNCVTYAEGQPANALGIKAPNCSRTVEESFNSPTFKLSLNYKPEATALIYGSISTGYRAGGFNLRGADDKTLQPYDPEGVVTYELGHKKDWEFGGVNVRTSLAAYVQNYSDIQSTVSFADDNGRLSTRTENAAKAQISGLEFDVTVQPTDGLRVDLSYSYVNANYLKRETTIDPVGAPPPRDVDTSSDTFPYIPMQSLTASTTYTLPLDAKLGEISLTAGAYWQDEMMTHPYVKEFPLYGWAPADTAAVTDFSQVDAYTVYNLRANWRGVMGSSFDVAAYVDNVTDEQYVLGGLNIMESAGYGAYHYGAPRTIGASLKYSF